jgi:periplasmic divalent cation tolerance protein
MTDLRIVLSTAGSHDEARRIANELVERRLAACVNIVAKIESIFSWKGKVQEGEEVLMIIKTTEAVFPKLRDAITELHTYEVPECLALAVEAGNDPYLKWVAESVEEPKMSP